MAKFAHSLDNFKPIDGQPSDSNLTRLREAVAPLLLHIPYDKTGAVHNLIGLIRPEAAYVARYGEAFPKPTRFGAYGNNIYNNATAIVHALSEAAHKAKRADRATYETARRETTQFVLAVVADTWVRYLQDSNSLYTEVSPRNSFLTSKQGAPAGTPSTSWRCIMKCSATTSMSRASPSTLTCSRTHKGKPAGRGKQFPTIPYSSLPARQ